MPPTFRPDGNSPMRLRPLRDRILVRRAEPETKSIGGIFIPDAVQ